MSSSVLRWPDRETVDGVVRAWSATEADRRPDLLRLGYFGSYARGDWGVGSDLDLVAVVEAMNIRFEARPVSWDLNPLPVPAEILVYSREEYEQLLRQEGRFAQMLRREVNWVFVRAA